MSHSSYTVSPNALATLYAFVNRGLHPCSMSQTSLYATPEISASLLFDQFFCSL